MRIDSEAQKCLRCKQTVEIDGDVYPFFCQRCMIETNRAERRRIEKACREAEVSQ